MLRHTDTVPVNGGGTAGDPGGSSSASRPKVTGDLDDLLSQASFHLRWRGYDRLEVENYVSWAESELLAARRQADHLLSRYGAASAELELSRRLLAQAPKGGRDLSSVSERVTEILRLAGGEAAATVEGGGPGLPPAGGEGAPRGRGGGRARSPTRPSPAPAWRPTPACGRPTRSRRRPLPPPTSCGGSPGPSALRRSRHSARPARRQRTWSATPRPSMPGSAGSWPRRAPS